MKSLIVPLLIACQAISVAAQLCLKLGARDAVSAFRRAPWRVALVPFLWAGGVLYVFGTVAWLKILTVADLSFAYPFAAVAYTAGVLVSQWTLKEKVTWLRWAGVALILAGLIMVSSSGISTSQR